MEISNWKIVSNKVISANTTKKKKKTNIHHIDNKVLQLVLLIQKYNLELYDHAIQVKLKRALLAIACHSSIKEQNTLHIGSLFKCIY